MENNSEKGGGGLKMVSIVVRLVKAMDIERANMDGTCNM